jgi:hypothetical protein
MCRRFTPVEASVNGSANDAGIGGAGRSVGPDPDGTPKRMTRRAREHVADIAVELAQLRFRGPIGDSEVSVLALGVEAF